MICREHPTCPYKDACAAYCVDESRCTSPSSPEAEAALLAELRELVSTEIDVHFAYLIGFISKATGTFLGASIFGEPHPTTNVSRLFTFEMFSMSAPSYGLAFEKIEAALALPQWQWLAPFVSRGSELREEARK